MRASPNDWTVRSRYSLTIKCASVSFEPTAGADPIEGLG